MSACPASPEEKQPTPYTIVVSQENINNVTTYRFSYAGYSGLKIPKIENMITDGVQRDTAIVALNDQGASVTYFTLHTWSCASSYVNGDLEYGAVPFQGYTAFSNFKANLTPENDLTIDIVGKTYFPWGKAEEFKTSTGICKKDCRRHSPD